MMMDELKDCPFCGGGSFSFWWCRDDLRRYWYKGTLECKECGARMVKMLELPFFDDDDEKKYRLKKACCEAWNMRV